MERSPQAISAIGATKMFSSIDMFIAIVVKGWRSGRVVSLELARV